MRDVFVRDPRMRHSTSDLRSSFARDGRRVSLGRPHGSGPLDLMPLVFGDPQKIWRSSSGRGGRRLA